MGISCTGACCATVNRTEVNQQREGKQMPEKPKKILYHSELCRLTDIGPTVMTIRTEPRDSKYQGKPPYVEVLLNGHVRNYNIENMDIEAALRDYTGQTVEFEAGGRDQEAYLNIVAAVTPSDEESGEYPDEEAEAEAGLAPQRRPEPSRAPRQAPARKAAPAQPQPRQPAPQRAVTPVSQDLESKYTQHVTDVKKFLGKRRNGMILCIRAARSIQAELIAKEDAPLTTEQVQAVASSLFISGDRERKWDDMPYKSVENYE